MEQHHDSHLTGHPGRWKTLELVSQNYWWPNMSQFIGQYCATCDLCLHTKVQRHRLMGELHPLPIPEEWWKVVSVDFCGGTTRVEWIRHSDVCGGVDDQACALYLHSYNGVGLGSCTPLLTSCLEAAWTPEHSDQ